MTAQIGPHRRVGSRTKARNRALAPPTLILPALQVNIRAGALPKPSAKGRVFLKLPVTQA